MRFNPATPWTKTFAARFRPMAQAQADGITIALFDSLRATDIEINEAVAKICSEWSNEGTPNIHHIADEIRALRNNGRTPLTANGVSYYAADGQVVQTTMRDLKSFLNARPEPEQAWDLICTPLKPDQCRELEAYCIANNIAYERYSPAPVDTAAIARKWKAA
jgi:hypothetical protein